QHRDWWRCIRDLARLDRGPAHLRDAAGLDAALLGQQLGRSARLRQPVSDRRRPRRDAAGTRAGILTGDRQHPAHGSAPASIHASIVVIVASSSVAPPLGMFTPEPPRSAWVPRSLATR